MADRIGNRVGQQFGNYQLVRLLGKGGFAEVYLGQHIYLNTPAAIKVLHAQLAQDEQARFLNEARTIARLIHPNIVRVLDFGMQAEQPFLVMDYAPNGSLRERHPRGTPLPQATVISYVKQVASALQYAHDEKLIHRDVKPENMLVGRGGEILLGDFGISVVSQNSQSLRTQEVVGSVPYMAPEQLQGRARPASDQYGLAIIVYEWFTGERPFQGSFTELYGQHIFTPPPPLRTKNAAISPDIERVVMTGLAKDPHQRFASVRAFAHALEQSLGGKPATPPVVLHDATTYNDSPSAQGTSPHAQATVQAPDPSIPAYVDTPVTLPQRPSEAKVGPQTVAKEGSPSPAAGRVWSFLSRRNILAGIGGLVVVCGGLAWYLESRPTLPERGTIITRYTKHSDSVNTIGWHPESDRIATAGKDGTVQIWNPRDGKLISSYANHGDSVNVLAWAPDGQRIVSAAKTIMLWDLTSKSVKLENKALKVSGYGDGILSLAWAPDGKYIASGSDGSDDVLIWIPETGKTYNKYKTGENIFPHGIGFLAWSGKPDLLATAFSSTIQLFNPVNGQKTFTYDKQSSISGLTWAPDNQTIASAGSDGIVVWDITAGAEQAKYTQHKDTVYTIVWSPDGKYIASAGKDPDIHVWDPRTGKTVYTYKHHKGAVYTLAWAGDSRRLASAGEDAQVVVWVAV